MKVACIQMTSAQDPAVNLSVIEARLRKAAALGATLIALPETCVFMERGKKAMQARLTAQKDNPDLKQIAALTAELGVHVLIGSMVLASDGGDKAVNRSLLLAPNGAVAAHYDKVHMFDVTLANGETHAESASYQPGERLALVDLGPDLEPDIKGAKLGLSICYDVRFPTLYRRLAEAGADIIAVPSAFTRPTGEAHWHILLRARAIETGCFIIAPAQTGTHENGRETYGHSLIIDPWGKVLAEAGDGDDMIIADIDMSLVAKARAQIPALQHGRAFVTPVGEAAHD